MTFESFWQRYPRRVGKGAARKAYARALMLASAEEIAAGVERYRTHVAEQGMEQRFVCHASTWLNQERWTDEYGLDVDPDPFAPYSDDVREAMQRRVQ